MVNVLLQFLVEWGTKEVGQLCSDDKVLLLSQAAGSVPVATSYLTVFSRLLHLTVGNAQFSSFGYHWKRGSLSVTIP